jgi:hypothetical protein
MKRDYEQGQSDRVVFFLGREVEHTPAFGMETLFVTGLHSTSEIETWLDKVTMKNVRHIFFGANHSYDPATPLEHDAWEKMIQYFLDKDYLCSLDIPINQVEEFHEGGLCEYDNFIPQIRVPIPYIKLWNYNTMLKIDDKDFKATNPGVWSHSLHTLMDRSKFTDWSQYKNDKVIK